ncbi:Manganese/iron superoxide dismutase [Mycena floridula]|nr:Manganese/iron superoxide dismutase [Mycena floridula]
MLRTRRLASSQSLLLLSRCRRSLLPFRRDAHATLDTQNLDFDKGLGRFLPPDALKAVAIDYQQSLLQKLNEEVKDEPEFRELSVVDTIIKAAARREDVLKFNYASMALNNNFFLSQLANPPEKKHNHQESISPDLAHAIRAQHGSVAQLKSNISAAAMGMFTSGWVWFVTDAAGHTAIVPTFGPGTLLVRSRAYMHDIDIGRDSPLLIMNPRTAEQEDQEEEEDQEEYEESSRSPPPPSRPRNGGQSRSIHTSAVRRMDIESGQGIGQVSTPYNTVAREQAANKKGPDLVGVTLYPLFCLSVHEHAWMSAGYGINGKEEWLKQFWSVVDWKKVSENYDKAYINTRRNTDLNM